MYNEEEIKEITNHLFRVNKINKEVNTIEIENLKDVSIGVTVNNIKLFTLPIITFKDHDQANDIIAQYLYKEMKIYFNL